MYVTINETKNISVDDGIGRCIQEAGWRRWRRGRSMIIALRKQKKTNQKTLSLSSTQPSLSTRSHTAFSFLWRWHILSLTSALQLLSQHNLVENEKHNHCQNQKLFSYLI
jgi:hypothetical protein